MIDVRTYFGKKRLLSVGEFCKFYGYTENRVRYLLYNKRFPVNVVRIGVRYYIDINSLVSDVNRLSLKERGHKTTVLDSLYRKQPQNGIISTDQYRSSKCVYFLAVYTTYDNRITKIGVTKNFSLRLRQLITVPFLKFEVPLLIETKTGGYRKLQELEIMLQNKYEHLRVTSEWFKLSSNDINTIRNTLLNSKQYNILGHKEIFNEIQDQFSTR